MTTRLSQRNETEDLCHAVRQRVSGLTVVEVGTEAHAEELVETLRDVLADRPLAVFDMIAAEGAAYRLLQEARQATADWPPEKGLLCVVDRTDRIDTETPDSPQCQFWRRMNLLREGWGALECHVVFFLKPRNYDLLLTVADDLADWFSLRYHLQQPPDETEVMTDRLLVMPTEPGLAGVSPMVARQKVEILERGLSEAKAEGESPQTLSRRYYLPLIKAELTTGNLQAARSLRVEIEESAVRPADLPEWWGLNIELDLNLGNLNAARKWAEKLLERARRNEDQKTESTAAFALGRVAEEMHEFEFARDWYRRALQGAENLGDQATAAAVLHQLGIVAQLRGDLPAAERHYRRSMQIAEEQGNSVGAAMTSHQLGILSHKRGDLEEAEEWYDRALETFHKLRMEHRAAGTYHQLGNIAHARRDSDAAQKWYLRALEIDEKLGNDRGAARTAAALGILQSTRGKSLRAAGWLIHSVEAFRRCCDRDGAERAILWFGRLYRHASTEEKEQMKRRWNDAGLGNFEEMVKRFEDSAGG